MQTITNYQMSVFGNFVSIKPTLEIMNSLAKAYTTIPLLPSTVNIISLDVIPQKLAASGQPNVLQRIQMVDPARKWAVVILPERIDVNFAKLQDDSDTIDSLAPTAYDLLLQTLKVCQIKYTRIAINLESVLRDDDPRKIDNFEKILVKPLKSQNGAQSSEWQVMTNTPKELRFTESHSERVNVIRSVSKKNEASPGVSTAVSLIDINTMGQNTGLRFGEAEMNGFYTSAIVIVKSILDELEREWNNAK